MIENDQQEEREEREQRVVGDGGREVRSIAVVDAGHPAPHGEAGQPDVRSRGARATPPPGGGAGASGTVAVTARSYVRWPLSRPGVTHLPGDQAGKVAVSAVTARRHAMRRSGGVLIDVHGDANRARPAARFGDLLGAFVSHGLPLVTCASARVTQPRRRPAGTGRDESHRPGSI